MTAHLPFTIRAPKTGSWRQASSSCASAHRAGPFDCPDGSPRTLKFFYYIASIVSLSANILCVANTTFLSVWGTGLLMRGPDGSLARAVDGMYQLRRNVFLLFGIGMMMGTMVLSAQAIGAGDVARSGQVWRVSMGIAAGLGIADGAR